MAKKVFTYDYNGDLIFVRNVRADILPSPMLNLPFKFNEIR
jgi:hypothetical protein